MGTGFNIKCDCKTYNLLLGVGRMYPSVYEEEYQKACSGEYGTELMDKLNENPNYYVDCSSKLMYCPKCGYFETGMTRDLYEITDEEVTDVFLHQLNISDYKLIHKTSLNCPKCNTQFKYSENVGKKVIRKLKCSDCGSKLTEGLGLIRWD